MNAEIYTRRDEAIWACLHGELDDRARQSLETDMAGDPVLRKRFEDSRRVDRLLRKTLKHPASADMTDEALAKQVMAALESEQDFSQPKTKPKTKLMTKTIPRRDFSEWFGFSLRAAAGIACLAASLYVLVSPTLRYSPVPRWAAPVFVPLTLRGTEVPGEKKELSPYTAKRCQTALSVALRQALETRSVILPTGLKFSLRLHELPQGAVAVSVQARTCDGRVVGDWTGDYSDVDAFLSQTDASASRMVENLLVKIGTVVKKDTP